MKKLILAALALALLVPALAVAGCGGKTVPAGAIAAVGDGVVTQSQYDQILKQAKAQYASQEGAPGFPKEGTAQFNQLKASIVSYLVENAVIKQKAAEMGVKVTAKQLEERLKQIVQQVGGQKKLDAILKKQGVSQKDLDEQLRAQMLEQAVRAKVGEGIKITDAQIKAYYENPDHKSQFVVPESVDARHVLVKTKAEAEKVQALLAADSSDANWTKVAKQYSTDPGSKDNGGSLGNFPKGRMVPPFEKVAFSIAVGTVSAPVKTQFGWHVIEVVKKIKGSTQTLAQAKAVIEQQLKYQDEAKAWEDWLTTAKKDAAIVYLTGFNPDQLTASPSPAGSAQPSASPTE